MTIIELRVIIAQIRGTEEDNNGNKKHRDRDVRY